MTTLDSWTAAACDELGIETGLVDVRQILDLARVAAHQVERPAAPLTAYLLGIAVGTGQRGRPGSSAADCAGDGLVRRVGLPGLPGLALLLSVAAGDTCPSWPCREAGARWQDT